MKNLRPIHYWLLIAALLLSNVLWICTTLDAVEQRDNLKSKLSNQSAEIEGLYEILEYKDSLINNNYICHEFCD
jgi:hypothetical protein